MSTLIKNNTTNLQLISDAVDVVEDETSAQADLIEQIMIALNIGDFIPVTYYLENNITVTSIITKVRPGKTYEITFISPNDEDLAYDIINVYDGFIEEGSNIQIKSGTTVSFTIAETAKSIDIYAAIGESSGAW